MEQLNYILTVLFSFLGIYVGFILAHNAKEELKDIHRYLVLAKFAILVSMLAFFFIAIGVDVWVSLILVVMAGITDFYVKSNIYEGIPSVILYPIFALIIFLLSKDKAFSFIASFMIFVFGMMISTILSQHHLKEKLKTLAKLTYMHISYLIIALGLYIVF